MEGFNNFIPPLTHYRPTSPPASPLTSEAIEPFLSADDAQFELTKRFIHSSSANRYNYPSTNPETLNPCPSFDNRTSIMPTVHLLDYVAGNIRSLVNAIEKLGYEVEWVRSPEDVTKADVNFSSSLLHHSTKPNHHHRTSSSLASATSATA